MSTGKRLAKRSIIGTRVCAPGEDGKFYSGVIHAVKTPASSFPETNNCINLTPNTRYSVRFDSRQGNLGRTTAEFREMDLIGPGFRSMCGIELVPTQKAFVTYNGREVCGEVLNHNVVNDEVIIRIFPPGVEAPFEVQKRLEEVRLLESRKSARLADQDTDFARLADMAGDRKRTASHTIDVPMPYHYGSRKRRPSSSHDDSSMDDTTMDECSAALVLMSLSCSPHSPNWGGMQWGGTSPESSSSTSNRSTPSPPPGDLISSQVLSTSAQSDEGIVMDYIEVVPKKKKLVTRVVFKCTWPTCPFKTHVWKAIEAHVKRNHFRPLGDEDIYYNDGESGYINRSSPPTLSHRDMARPPHEDPEYQRQIVGTYRQTLYSGPINIPQSPHKQLKLSPRPHSPKMPASPRRLRGENKKCRKVYGMEHREQWCTQCKWKKACSRFGD